MFKKFLHLYNDGHNPFPHMKGYGFGPYGEPNDRGDRDIGYYADDTMTQEEADAKNAGIWDLIAEIPEVKEAREKDELEHPERYIPNVQTKEEYEFEKATDAYEKEMEKYVVDYNDEMTDINNDIRELQLLEKKILTNNYTSPHSSVQQLEDFMSQIVAEEKDLKKTLITHNIHKKKIIDELYKLSEMQASNFFKAMPKKGEVYTSSVRKGLNDFVDEMNEYDESETTKELLLSEVMKFTKSIKGKLNETIPVIINYTKGLIDHPDIATVNKKYFEFVNIMLLKLNFKEEFKTIDKIDEANENINKGLKELQNLKFNTKLQITQVQVGAEEIKNKQKQYSVYQSQQRERDRVKEDRVIKQLEEYKRRIDTQPEITTQEATEIKELLLEAKKIKKEKPIKKSEGEKHEDITRADISGRLQHIEDTISPYGKDLETYLSKKGGFILKYITNDNSEIYDNEFNKNIPDIMVTLNNGKTESLRKAVTLDLYNNKNVFEIKNYKQYSISDDIIPLQETKLEGTYYFKPLYLKNGNLYNIELTYSDDTGEHKKYILPENTDGRELVLIYRLKDGLYQYKPIIGKEVSLQHTTNTTSDGKALYVFKNAKYNKCKDHHGNPSFNIKPYLTKIKI